MATPSVPNDAIRVGDREREAMSERLTKAHSLGQLTLEEFDERVIKVHAARTRGELSLIDADLPSERGDRARRGGPRDRRPDAAGPRRSFGPPGGQRFGGPDGPPTWAKIALVLLAIWIVSKIAFGLIHGVFHALPLLLIAGAIAFFISRRGRRAHAYR